MSVDGLLWRMTPDVKWYKDWKLVRNIVLFLAGLAGLITMTAVWVVTGRTPDPSLLIAFTAMLGLPVFLHADEDKNK